jgi:uncharacterized membrane protein (UPF0127 family)
MLGLSHHTLRRAIVLGGFTVLPIAVLPLASCRTTTAGESQPETSQSKTKAAANAPKPVGARVVLSPPGQDPVTVAVEVVDTNESRQRGLMYRKHLGPDEGMLFIFDREEHHTFWMHNTLIPLDMIFIKSDWTVLGIVENAEPLTDSLRSVPGDSQYVLEVNAGFSRSHGLQSGTSVQYVAAARGEENH